MVKFFQSLFQMIGRWCIAAIFIFSGIGKVMAWDLAVESMQRVGIMHMTEALCAASVFIEIFAGLSFAFGMRPKLSGSILALFLAAMTYYFHDFWNIEDLSKKELQMVAFLNNLAIFGGLLYFIATPNPKESKPLDTTLSHK